MPFQEKSDAYTYIDASQATPEDRLKVTFENGMTLYLKARSVDSKYYDYGRELNVDTELTTPAIIADLHDCILGHEKYQESHRLPFLRKRWTLADIREKVRLRVTVEKSVFDQSPRVGSTMKVWGLMPNGGTSYTVADDSLVAKVESITID